MASTTTQTPRTPDGDKLCAWCGGSIRQSGVGRSRDYCSRTCREMAYRERRTQKLIAQALADAALVSSTDGSSNQDLSVDEMGRLADLPPLPAQPVRKPSPNLRERLAELGTRLPGTAISSTDEIIETD
jgi:hypothetical protein